ncbi:MAG: response regulator transcription factor [Caldilineaceae bacterium]|nr:response regulator transcription factor [Caldilineaceae bacterium]
MPIRILFADDHSIVRRGLVSLIQTEPDMTVVGEATDSNEALRMVEQLRPDVAVLDLSMPGTGGVEVTRQLTKYVPSVRVLILTFDEDEGMFHAAMSAGAAGYILKRAADAELVQAIRSVAKGEPYVHPRFLGALLRGFTDADSSASEPAQILTGREQEVLVSLARGYTNREIAETLRISVRTVESHRANLMSKLRLRTRFDLVNYAEEHGLLS